MRKHVATEKKLLRKAAAGVLAFLLLLPLAGGVLLPVMEAEADDDVLELTESTTSGDNWTWDGSTLTLSGATIDKCVWFKTSSATIVLTDGTANTIRGGQYGSDGNNKYYSGIVAGTPSSNGRNVESAGDLTIRGSGSLAVTPSTNSSFQLAYAINCYGLTIGDGSDNPDLQMSLPNATLHSYCVHANQGGITVNSGTINLTCGSFSGGNQNHACGFMTVKGDVTIQNGSVTVTVTGGTDSCAGFLSNTAGDITIHGGTVALTVQGTRYNASGIWAVGNVTIDGGSLQLRNTNGSNKYVVHAGDGKTLSVSGTLTNCARDGNNIVLDSNAVTGTIDASSGDDGGNGGTTDDSGTGGNDAGDGGNGGSGTGGGNSGDSEASGGNGTSDNSGTSTTGKTLYPSKEAKPSSEARTTTDASQGSSGSHYSSTSSGSSTSTPAAGATAATVSRVVTTTQVPFGMGRRTQYGKGSVVISAMAVDANGNPLYNGALLGDTAQILSACFSPEELAAVTAGAQAQIRFIVTDEPASLTEEEKQTIAAAYPQLNVGVYYDLTLEKKLGDADWQTITEANGELAVMFDIPERLRQTARIFSILRDHEGRVVQLSDRDTVDDTVTITTGLFSTYALAYADGTVKENASPKGIGAASPKTGDVEP